MHIFKRSNIFLIIFFFDVYFCPFLFAEDEILQSINEEFEKGKLDPIKGVKKEKLKKENEQSSEIKEKEDFKNEKLSVKDENGVFILTTNNFDDWVNSKDFVLVEFYAPWCGHCKQLAPEYEKAAKKLIVSDPPVFLAKVDATIEPDLGNRFSVTGYPTLKFFRKGVPEDYDGPREENGIVNYIKEKTDPNYKHPPEITLTLTSENFTKYTQSEELLVVMFYAPWCGHCKQTLPEFERAAQDLLNHSPPLHLAKVDATVEKDLATKYDINSYPTFKVFRKGNVFQYKNEDRKKSGFIDYVKKLAEPPSQELKDLQEIKKKLLNTGDSEFYTIIAFLQSEMDPEFLIYSKSANELRDDYSFYHTFDEQAAKSYKATINSLAIFMSNNFHTKYEPKMKTQLIKIDSSTKDISDFVKANDTPLVGEFNQKTKDRCYKEKKPIIFFFYSVDWSFDHRKATQMWRYKFAEIAILYRDLLTFVIADEYENKELLKEFGLEDSPEELNVGILSKNNEKFAMEPMEEYDADDVIAFIDKFKEDKLKAKIMSQSPPKSQPGPVIVVVGKTFENIVMDPTKDVLIELYAPWCGHCKKVEPIYKELARKVKSESNLVIAKMDATANDVPKNFPASGFPTFYFAPATNKKNPITFSGGRTVNEMLKFVEKHASVSFGSRQSLKSEL